jgi:hypothetical protein
MPAPAPECTKLAKLMWSIHLAPDATVAHLNTLRLGLRRIGIEVDAEVGEGGTVCLRPVDAAPCDIMRLLELGLVLSKAFRPQDLRFAS